MTWHSLIFFRDRARGVCRPEGLRPARWPDPTVLVGIFLGLSFQLGAATVTGRVELEDVRGRANYAGLVVSLLPVDQPPVLTPARATIRQKGKMFLPHILAVTAGTVVDFPNDDPIFHNAFSNYNGQIFDLTLYAPGTTRSVRFTRPGVVRIFCNIHASMSAVIVVLKTPYFAVSKRDGTFVIPDVPPGGYQLSVFHERATDASLRALDQHVTVPESNFELPAIVVSETGYLPVPHNNKYGRPYPPAKDENQVYPGVRN
jgi:plastocyanin